MINLAVILYSSDKGETFIFGDFAADIEAGKRAGITSVYVATRHDEYENMQSKIKEKHPDVFKDRQFANLAEAVRVFD